MALTDKQICVLANEISTSKYLCEMGLNQVDTLVKDEEEKIELTEAHDYLQGLRTNYQELETEIVQDNQLDMTTPLQ